MLVYYLVISVVNIGLCYEGLQDYEVYYFKINVEDFVVRFVDVIYINNFFYNDDYLCFNEINIVGVFNLEFDNVNRFFYWIICSWVYNNEVKNFFLWFFVFNDYYEMVRGKGEIIVLWSYGQYLVIIMEYVVFLIVGKEQLVID